jgi:hypothetical protein
LRSIVNKLALIQFDNSTTIITKCFGTSLSFNYIIILSLSIFYEGKEEGFEPVAIMIFLASMVSEVPSRTTTCVASTNEYPSEL